MKGLQNRALEVVNTSRGTITGEGREDDLHRHDRQVKPLPGHHSRSGAADPHIWLDFRNAVTMVENIRDGLVKKDPAGKDVYEKNAASTIGQLQPLDERFLRGPFGERVRVRGYCKSVFELKILWTQRTAACCPCDYYYSRDDHLTKALTGASGMLTTVPSI